MTDSPWLTLALIAGGGYFTFLWWQDFSAQRAGKPNPGALPGATPTTWLAVIVAVLGGLLIVAAETWGELRLGIADEQSQVTVLFCLYTLLAAVIEEIIFRGFIVPAESRGRATLLGGVFAASLVFALAHPFLWSWGDEGLTLNFGTKGWFSTAAVFVSSLWFYYVRFMSANSSRSLLPCFAAHGAKNLAVIIIKAAQGFVVGWF
ncbi:CPBP family glutamic-type intramembrane protease [Actomonas aquatica]|uniref:CPBP family glutamic-type intramembrane protease n=1 Tax=Actomonas aquatica TaxID=2866162 RepID=A0ABZ1C4Z3_9BACT|nr:CPBP family glutamic-type intramembrane protease [Opitutus sp. WL0086]WRQ86801.1 CPBP family glutamic-type intramembrane protease [Opitutus sp. WL0086]